MAKKAKKILIVDHNEASRKSLVASVKSLGYEIGEAATGLEAIDNARSMQPDLILLELRLPDMNGDEVTARLKRNSATRHIPVLINTGWNTDCNIGDRVARALDLGAAEILYKPFHLAMLREVLRSYLLA